MTVATLLPANSADHVARVLRTRADMLKADSWRELESLLDRRIITTVLLDPTVEGDAGRHFTARLLSRHFLVPFLAYVPVNPVSLSIVARLSTCGLAGIILHPAHEPAIADALDRVSASMLTRQLVGTFEASLRALSPSTVLAIQDLFQRPLRYESAVDLALQAEASPSKLRRELRESKLGPAQKLVIVARLLRSYGYLLNTDLRIEEICGRVGYANRRVFAEHTHLVFQCSPSRLRSNRDSEEVVKYLLDWLYKPSKRRPPRTLARAANGISTSIC